MIKINIEKLKKEAEEYRKYLKRVSEIAEEEAKNSGDKIGSQGERTQKKLLELQNKGFNDYKSLREKEFNELKVSNAKGEISNEEYYQKLAQLRDIYFNEGTNEWTRYTLQIANYNSDIVEQQKKELYDMFDDVNCAYAKSLDEMAKKQEEIKGKLSGISDIYNVIEGGDKNDGGYRWIQLSDINTELEALKNYNKNLIAARDRINQIFDGFEFDDDKTAKLKSGFLDELAQMNVPDATQFTKYLTTISETRLTDYLSKWAEKVDLTETISKDVYSQETQDLAETYAQDMAKTFTVSLTEKFGELPDGFFQNGSDAAYKFKEGFISSIDEVLGDISKEINQRIAKLLPEVNVSGGGTQVSNYSSYNIYGATQPQMTALEIYKDETRRRMLIGED